jgi:hypothetical protein
MPQPVIFSNPQAVLPWKLKDASLFYVSHQSFYNHSFILHQAAKSLNGCGYGEGVAKWLGTF